MISTYLTIHSFNLPVHYTAKAGDLEYVKWQNVALMQ